MAGGCRIWQGVLHPHAFYVGCKIWRYTGITSERESLWQCDKFRTTIISSSFIQGHNACNLQINGFNKYLLE